MPVEASPSPPMHEPHHSQVRPKGIHSISHFETAALTIAGILKNPSFSGQGGASEADVAPTPPSAPLDAQESKDLTLQNTIQNAGHRRSSSAARRSSASRRHSSAAGLSNGEDPDGQRLKWDEANLYLAEQEAGGRMKITEPKTPFEYGNSAMDEDEEEDVSIDPRYVNVDEVEMAKNRSSGKKARESEIPDMNLGEPEDENAGADLENDRIVRQGSMSRESSKEKHVNVASDMETAPGMPTGEEEEKHRLFEEQRKKHYEMRNVKDMLG